MVGTDTSELEILAREAGFRAVALIPEDTWKEMPFAPPKAAGEWYFRSRGDGIYDFLHAQSGAELMMRLLRFTMHQQCADIPVAPDVAPEFASGEQIPTLLRAYPLLNP